MNWKEFLKPDWRKIVIFVILFIFFCLFDWSLGMTKINRGFPFVYLKGNWDPGRKGMWDRYDEFDLVSLLLDIIIYYVISCLIVWVYDKYKKKRIR